MDDPGSTRDQARLRAEELLRTVAFAAERLLSLGDWEQALREILPALARSTEASRVSVLQAGESGGPAPRENERIWGSDETSDAEEPLDVPIFAQDAAWGRLCIQRPQDAPAWSEPEVRALRSLAGVLGASIERARKERAFHDAETRYRTLVEQIPAVTYVDVCEGPEVDIWLTEYISPQVESILGYSPEEWRADPSLWFSLILPEDRDRANAADERHYVTGEPLQSEYRLRARDGRIVWILDIATIATGSDGRRYSQGVLSDVTERKEREHQLEAAEARYRALVEHTPAVTYQEVTEGIYDAANSMMYISPQIEEILGYPAESWSAVPGFWTTILHPDDLERVMAESDRTTEERLPYSQEYRMMARDGRIVWFHDEAVVIRNERGEPQLWQGVMVDITRQKEAEERLRATQGRYRALVEHIPAVTYTQSLDASPEDFYISPQALALFGYDPEEWRWTEHFWQDHIHPDDRERVTTEDRRTKESGDRYEIEYRIIAKDGRAVWIHDEATLIADEQGAPRYWQGFMLDITERKRADENVRAAEEKFRALVEQNPAVIYTDVIDPAGHSITAYMSPSTESVTGYTVDDFQEDPDLWRKIVHPEERERVLTEDVEGNRTGEAFDMQYRMIAKDGREVWIHDQATLIRDPEGRPAFWQGFMLDITEQKQAEGRVRLGEIKYRSLVENIPAVTYVEAVDLSPVDFFISPQLESILGYTPEEWVASEDFWESHIHPDDVEAVREEDERTDVNSEPFDVEYRFRHKDGRWIWIRESAVVVRDEDGKEQYWQGFMLDITERKEAEQAIEHALEIEREATARLRSLDEMKNTFLQAVSHDLRTPLAAILGLAVTLERADLQLDVEDAHDLARRISGNARKLDRLVIDLLDLDRLARGIVEPKLHPTDVPALVRRVVSESDVSDVRTVEVDTDPVVVPADASKVERIVENLLANTVRHTPAMSRVWVRVLSEPEGAVLVVEDEGPGIPPELKEAVFEPFLQGPDAPTHSPGVGVGLALVARFAELHGGRAWVQDRPGGGASFRVLLPAEPLRGEVQVRAAG
ncbi:MAG: PAS domain-containing protein [Actinomycetota bacterium]|nr:PAS domain-containing protein [Actinomycetota bacterium]